MERGLVDTVGFAHTAEQLEMVLARIDQYQGKQLREVQEKIPDLRHANWKVFISPHDDYTYVGYLYPALLSQLKSPLVILFGVAHKAGQLNLRDQIIFDSHQRWHGPYSPIPVSRLREEIIEGLPKNIYQVNNEMQDIEHSIEGILPFLQYYQRELEIVPILVTPMNFSRMDSIARELSRSIFQVTEKRELVLGRDYMLVISTDAVHYGDQDWGGRNFAFMGNDSNGYRLAVEHEYEIINQTLTGHLLPQKVKRLTEYLLEDDFLTMKWTWCGRYSVPLGLLTAYYLSNLRGEELKGTLVGYATSIDRDPIPVDDLGMGITAPANLHHWVGYAAIGYR